MNRRDFIKGCSASLALLAAPSLNVYSQILSDQREHCFVFVFLRGGCDGLQLVAPASDRTFQDARPHGLKVNTSGNSLGHLLENGLDDIGFYLHPEAAGLYELYQEGDLAILHGCGLPNGTRSHFEAMALIERGIASKEAVTDGWMARLLKALEPKGKLPALATSGGLPLSLSGYLPTACIPDIDSYRFPTDHDYSSLLRKWYSSSSHLDQTAQMTLDTMETVANLKFPLGNPKGYPKEWYAHDLSNSMQTLAKLIRSDCGVRVATVNHMGWDTHEDQVSQFPMLVRTLSQSLTAFYQDLAGREKDVTVVVMSEFGRRLRANKSNGTDHGHGNMMMVLGKGVKGGRMYGKWPGLDQRNLDKGVDLAISTDYRTVLGEVLQERMGVSSLATVFPGFEMPTKLNLFKTY